VGVRVDVIAGVLDVAMAVVARLDGVERDALLVELPERVLVLGVSAFLGPADDVVGLVPRPHRELARATRGNARYASMRRV
jgi:hypothetical protein